MSQTRRLTAILAADVAGYSRLMGADEEGTHERLKAHLRELVDPKIAEHRGRIVKNTGDGFLAEFPSVVDAVRCAVQVQRGMAARVAAVPAAERIEFRVGVNIGDVMVEDHDIFGDGVNVAARLEAFAEPGGICVSRVVRDQVRDRLDFLFEDMGEQQVKNIARPVRVYRVRDNAVPVGQPLPGSAQRLRLPDKPSLAVLPFTNMSGDPEQEFVADGIVEDIITALSRCPWLLVIARNSSFTYKGRAVDLKQVGRQLGARYVLEGSVRSAAGRIRVTAQLVEAETGNHIWANRYDRDLADIFSMQDEITEAVSVAVAPAIADAEVRRAVRQPTGNLDAWAAFQRGQWHMHKFNPNDNALAQKFFQKAADIDPTFAGGYKGLAWAQCQSATTLQTRNRIEAQNSAETLARRAVALDPVDAEAHSCLALTLWLRGDYQGALAEAGEALKISPNYAFAHALLGAALIFSGQPRVGIAAVQTAIKLDPYDPMLPSRLNHVTVGFYFCREYETAVEVARQAIRSNPDYPLTYRWLAAALGQIGDTDDAKKAMEKAIAIAPASFDMYVRNRVPWMRLEDHAHMLEGLRKAGMPEE
jgi:adenylate cyclase